MKKFMQDNLAIGLMLFALFLGAGNIIFPPELGQKSGEEIFWALAGFLTTGVGLPLLAIVAIAKSGGDLLFISQRINPMFGLIFTSIVYLSIGPLFAWPRTATVSYEIAVVPYLSDAMAASPWPLIMMTIVFFALTLFIAMNPTKIVDIVGKILTPLLLIVIVLLTAKAILTPMGGLNEPSGNYIENPFTEGFVQGYFTMDMLAGLVFGLVVIQALKARGIKEPKKIVSSTIYAGIIAAIGLAFVYVSLGFIGATSTDTIGFIEGSGTGSAIIAAVAQELYGSAGQVILSAIILLACLTTSVGLATANAQFFNKVYPKFSYKTYLIVFSLFSGVVANFGLSTLLSITLPVLMLLYPLAMVIIFLSLAHNTFGGRPAVYIGALLLTLLVSINDGLVAAGIEIEAYQNVLNALPLQGQGLGWLVPAIVGAIIGYIVSSMTKK